MAPFSSSPKTLCGAHVAGKVPGSGALCDDFQSSFQLNLSWCVCKTGSREADCVQSKNPGIAFLVPFWPQQLQS